MSRVSPAAVASIAAFVGFKSVTLSVHAQSQNCSPSYPDFCIPPAPPNLDCSDIQRQNFRVLPPDPHRFDRDKDGIGCESQ